MSLPLSLVCRRSLTHTLTCFSSQWIRFSSLRLSPPLSSPLSRPRSRRENETGDDVARKSVSIEVWRATGLRPWGTAYMYSSDSRLLLPISSSSSLSRCSLVSPLLASVRKSADIMRLSYSTLSEDAYTRHVISLRADVEDAWAAIFLLLTDSWDEFNERHKQKVPFLNNGSLPPPASSSSSLSSSPSSSSLPSSSEVDSSLSTEQDKTSQDILALFNSTKKKRIRGKVYGQIASAEGDSKEEKVEEEKGGGKSKSEALSIEEVNECYRFFSHQMKEALSRLRDSLQADERRFTADKTWRRTMEIFSDVCQCIVTDLDRNVRKELTDQKWRDVGVTLQSLHGDIPVLSKSEQAYVTDMTSTFLNVWMSYFSILRNRSEPFVFSSSQMETPKAIHSSLKELLPISHQSVYESLVILCLSLSLSECDGETAPCLMKYREILDEWISANPQTEWKRSFEILSSSSLFFRDISDNISAKHPNDSATLRAEARHLIAEAVDLGMRSMHLDPQVPKEMAVLLSRWSFFLSDEYFTYVLSSTSGRDLSTLDDELCRLAPLWEKLKLTCDSVEMMDVIQGGMEQLTQLKFMKVATEYFAPLFVNKGQSVTLSTLNIPPSDVTLDLTKRSEAISYLKELAFCPLERFGMSSRPEVLLFTASLSLKMFVHMIGVTSGEENYDWIAKFGIRLAKNAFRKNIKWPASFVGLEKISDLKIRTENLVTQFPLFASPIWEDFISTVDLDYLTFGVRTPEGSGGVLPKDETEMEKFVRSDLLEVVAFIWDIESIKAEKQEDLRWKLLLKLGRRMIAEGHSMEAVEILSYAHQLGLHQDQENEFTHHRVPIFLAYAYASCLWGEVGGEEAEELAERALKSAEGYLEFLNEMKGQYDQGTLDQIIVDVTTWRDRLQSLFESEDGVTSHSLP